MLFSEYEEECFRKCASRKISPFEYIKVCFVIRFSKVKRTK